MDTDRSRRWNAARRAKHSERMTGLRHPMARPVGTLRIHKCGTVSYIKVKVTESKWRYEHRVVAERKIGRPLESGEHVHHINGDTFDNSPSNLAVLKSAEHTRHHLGLAGRFSRAHAA